MANARGRPAAIAAARRVVVGCALGAAIVTALYAANRVLTDVPFNQLLRDPGQVTGVSPAVGALTFVGWFGWTSAAVTLCTAGWLRGKSGSPDRQRFLLATGLLTGFVLADDAFQLHESVLVDLTGVHEYVWYLVHLAVLGMWALAFRRELWPPPLELAVAAALIALSQVLEMVPGPLVLWEESLKLLGIGWYVAFSVVELRAAAARLFDPGPRSAEVAPHAPCGAGSVTSSSQPPEGENRAHSHRMASGKGTVRR